VHDDGLATGISHIKNISDKFNRDETSAGSENKKSMEFINRDVNRGNPLMPYK
jgi:hypothetical protein